MAAVETGESAGTGAAPTAGNATPRAGSPAGHASSKASQGSPASEAALRPGLSGSGVLGTAGRSASQAAKDGHSASPLVAGTPHPPPEEPAERGPGGGGRPAEPAEAEGPWPFPGALQTTGWAEAADAGGGNKVPAAWPPGAQTPPPASRPPAACDPLGPADNASGGPAVGRGRCPTTSAEDAGNEPGAAASASAGAASPEAGTPAGTAATDPSTGPPAGAQGQGGSSAAGTPAAAELGGVPSIGVAGCGRPWGALSGAALTGGAFAGVATSGS